MYEIATIPFKETPGFLSIRDNQTGEIYVSPKSISEIFEIDWGGQQQKLSEDFERWDYRTISVTLPGNIQQRNVAVIPDRKVRTWICGINPKKVKPEVRPQLEAFQKECDQVLYDYWTRGVAVNPRYQIAPSGELKAFIGEVVGTAVKSAIEEVSKNLIEKTVKLTMAEIRSEDPVYLAAKKWDIIERMDAKEPLAKEQIVASQQAILNILIPGSRGKSLSEMSLTHSVEWIYQKSLEGYQWAYKTIEAAAAQLTKIAKKLWETDNYKAFKESVTLKTGRTVEVYVFPILYAEKAFAQMVEVGKIYKA